ncbi:hypothetical protein ACL02R_02405 [Streptomyces sp. MS19]
MTWTTTGGLGTLLRHAHTFLHSSAASRPGSAGGATAAGGSVRLRPA